MEMVTYPLNNVEYTAEDAELYNSTRTSGVYDGESDFNLSLDGGLNVIISPGLAWIQNAKFKGKVVALKEPTTITLPDPPSTFERYDVIAIRFDALQNNSEIVVIRGGNAGSHAVMPERNVSEDLYELFLYRIFRPVNKYEISAEWVGDLRKHEHYCGIMSDSVNNALPLQGGNMRGSINMNGSLVFGLGYPTGEDDAATKAYVDESASKIAIPDFNYPDCFYRTFNGEKEWINPPMELGVEYRTTERFKGKAVYISLVDLGYMPSVGDPKKVFVASGVNEVVDVKCVAYNGLNYTFSYSVPLIDAETIFASFNLEKQNGDLYAQIKSNQSLESYIANCTIKYTK